MVNLSKDKTNLVRNRIVMTGDTNDISSIVSTLDDLVRSGANKVTGFSVNSDTDTVLFDTENNRGDDAVKNIAEKYPAVALEYCWASGNFGTNAGMAEYENGEQTSEDFYNDYSQDAHELAEDLWNGKQ